MNRLLLALGGTFLSSFLLVSTLPAFASPEGNHLGRGTPPAASAPTIVGRDSVSQHAKSPHFIDEWGKHFMGVPVCEGPKDLDCVEGLRVRSDGHWVTATLVEWHWERHRDSRRGLMEGVQSTWSYNSASEGETFVVVQSTMQPRKSLLDGKPALDYGLFIDLWRRADSEHPSMGPDDLNCASGRISDCTLTSPALPSADYFEVSARTSWLRDNGTSIAGGRPRMTQEPIPGGTRWTIAAHQILSSYPRKGQWGDPTMPALGWLPRWGLSILHAGESTEDSAWDPGCAEYGAPWSAGGSGRLHWVKSKRTFDFELHAPHLDPFGEPLEGDFTAQIPLAWLRCFAGKAVKPAYLSLSVVDEEGQEQVATTAIRVRKGTVFARATGFHFSSPTIELGTAKRR